MVNRIMSIKCHFNKMALIVFVCMTLHEFNRPGSYILILFSHNFGDDTPVMKWVFTCNPFQ